MLTYGFTIPDMVELVRSGLLTPRAERLIAWRQKMEVARLRITGAGRGRL